MAAFCEIKVVLWAEMTKYKYKLEIPQTMKESFNRWLENNSTRKMIRIFILLQINQFIWLRQKYPYRKNCSLLLPFTHPVERTTLFYCQLYPEMNFSSFLA